jgi:multidrug efflux pump subunit AcrA (membrane-fusion protein)
VKTGTGGVWVVQQDQAKRRTVKTGGLDRDWVEVTSGLAAGDRVIIRGGFNVQEGDRLKVNETGVGK